MKILILFITLLIPCRAIAGHDQMAVMMGLYGAGGNGDGLAITDDFNRADSSDLGTNWTPRSNSLRIVSNTATSTASTTGIEMWNANTFSADQKVCGKFNSSVNAGSIIARLSDSALTYYYASSVGGILYLRKKVNDGTPTTLDSETNDVSGDTVCISVTGTSTTSLSVTVNGVERLSATDSSSPITSGQPGILVYSTTVMIDDFAAEEL